MSEEVISWISKNFNHINLSLDGPRNIHNLQRPLVNGKGTYDKVIDTIKKLDKAGSLKRINTVVTPYSINRMKEIITHIESLCSVGEVRMLPMSYCGRCESSDIQHLDIDEFQRNLEEIIPFAKSLGIKIVTVTEQLNYVADHYCGACGFNMCVSPDGIISSCVEVMNRNDPGAKDLIIGMYDSYNRKIEINWDKVSFLRKRTYETVPGCKECVFRTNCSGGCLVRAARNSGTIMSYDHESCKLVKKTLRELLINMADNSE